MSKNAMISEFDEFRQGLAKAMAAQAQKYARRRERERARRQAAEFLAAIGWIALLTGFVLVMTYLTPDQRSAEADLFDAECRAKGVAP